MKWCEICHKANNESGDFCLTCNKSRTNAPEDLPSLLRLIAYVLEDAERRNSI